MRKFLLTVVLGIGVGMGSVYAEDVVIKTRPPHAVVETRPARPSAGHVWVGGYHRWDGNAYAWTPGKWDTPPHPHATWVAPRYVHKNGGYVFVEGRWK